MPTSLRRRTLIAAALLGLSGVTAAQQHSHDNPFEKIPPPPQPAGKIEIVEFFQYGCGHCSKFEPVMAEWKKKQAGDIVVRRVPVAFDNARVPHVRIFYTLEALNLVDKLHAKVFEAVIEQRLPMTNTSEIADFMEGQGVNRRQWLDNFGSFMVSQKTMAAAQIWRSYQVDGTPAVGVAGKFLTAPFMAGSNEATIKIMNDLVAQERAARK